MQVKEKTPTTEPDVDDVEVHAFACDCDECCENLYLMMQEDRA